MAHHTKLLGDRLYLETALSQQYPALSRHRRAAERHGWSRLQNLHGAAQPRCSGKAGIGGEQGRIELLGEGHIEGVIGGDVGAQLPGPGPEGATGVAAQAEAIRGGQRLQGMTFLQLVGQNSLRSTEAAISTISAQRGCPAGPRGWSCGRSTATGERSTARRCQPGGRFR